MTDEAVLRIVAAVCTALPPTLVAWGALRQGKKNGVTAEAAAASADIAATQADTAAKKADELHDITKTVANNTNGHLSQLTSDLGRAMTQIKGLEDTVVTLSSILTAGRVAQASAEGKPTQTVPAVRSDDLAHVIDTLKDIKQHHDDPPNVDQRSPKP